MMIAPFIIGVALIVLTVKRVEQGLLKKFLLTIGASVIGFPIFALLHNVVYGIFIHFFGKDFRNGGDEPFFFVMAIVICPLGFLVGAIGSIILTIRRFKTRNGQILEEHDVQDEVYNRGDYPAYYKILSNEPEEDGWKAGEKMCLVIHNEGFPTSCFPEHDIIEELKEE